MAITERTPLAGGAERPRALYRHATAGLIVCAFLCVLAMMQLGSPPDNASPLAATSTELAEQSDQGFFSALQTSGSHTMMQAGGFVEEVGAHHSEESSRGGNLKYRGPAETQDRWAESERTPQKNDEAHCLQFVVPKCTHSIAVMVWRNRDLSVSMAHVVGTKLELKPVWHQL